jgi:hypothetical protein
MLFIEDLSHDSLYIKCEPLNFNADGTSSTTFHPRFFQPLPIEALHAHPINTQSADVREEIMEDEKELELDRVSMPYKFGGGHELYARLLEAALSMCLFMEGQFSCFPRMGTEYDNGLALMHLTKWRPG